MHFTSNRPIKSSVIKSRKKGKSRKLALIGAIINYSKIAHEQFNIEILTFEELNKMLPDQLSNVYTELRIQLNIPRSPNGWRST